MGEFLDNAGIDAACEMHARAALKAATLALGAPVKIPRKKPTALLPRSMEVLRAEGYLVAVTEHWNSFAHIKQDLWNFCDLLAIRRNEVLAVQVTDASNLAHRRTKIADNPNVPKVREAGIRIEIHSWRKVAGRWQMKPEDLS